MIIDFHKDLNYQYINIDNIIHVYCNFIYTYINHWDTCTCMHCNFGVFFNKTYR